MNRFLKGIEHRLGYESAGLLERDGELNNLLQSASRVIRVSGSLHNFNELSMAAQRGVEVFVVLPDAMRASGEILNKLGPNVRFSSSDQLQDTLGVVDREKTFGRSGSGHIIGNKRNVVARGLARVLDSALEAEYDAAKS